MGAKAANDGSLELLAVTSLLPVEAETVEVVAVAVASSYVGGRLEDDVEGESSASSTSVTDEYVGRDDVLGMLWSLSARTGMME